MSRILYRGKIAGVSFNKGELARMVNYFTTVRGNIEPTVRLEADPANPYDKNAIKVHICHERESFFLGHIPKTHNVQLLEHGIENLNVTIDHPNVHEGKLVGFDLLVMTKETG